MSLDESAKTRLTTWKAIAAFIGRDERTAKRWEASRGLPVRRAPGGRSTVYAERRELEAWLASASVEAAPAPASRGSWRWWGVAAAALLLIGAAFTGASLQHPKRNAPPPALYSQAVYLMNTRSRAGLNEAVADFSRLTLQSPRYAPGYAGLAASYDLMPEFGEMRPVEAFAQARTAAERALALDPNLAEAERALGFAEFWGLHDVAASRRAFDKAIRLDPNDATAYHWYANILTMLGEERAARETFASAERLDPASTSIRVDHANSLEIFGHTREAREILDAVIGAEPQYARAQVVRAFVEDMAGDYPAALDAMEKAAALSGEAEGAALAQAGRAGFAQGGVAGMRQAIRARQEALYAGGGQSPYNLAISLAPVDPTRALDLLDACSQAGEPTIMGLRADPRLAVLHRQPRFKALLAHLGLPALQA